MSMTEIRPVARLAVDTGGTFTDLVVEDDQGKLTLYKCSTTPDEPWSGIRSAIALAADARGKSVADVLGECEMFVYGTTHAINAVLTSNTARTALITTDGHREVLLIREGGRLHPFDTTRPYPEPYIPRSLTFGVPERIESRGHVLVELDEVAVTEVLGQLRVLEVEAVAVCLLWSIRNPAHELRIGELIEQHLPGVPYTLSHRLNPIAREHRRASSVAIDASLKPVMTRHFRSISTSLSEAGFAGRMLIVGSGGGVKDAAAMADAPIHCLNSGPSMAPVAGRYYSARDTDATCAIIADTGGTSYDVSLIRDGSIPRTDETWLVERIHGFMTGFPSIDVKSIGAGGGSIASVDSYGLLHVGPASAGSVPGPVCYGRGGLLPTVTDACVALGYINPSYFAGGMFELDVERAREAIRQHVAGPLGLSIDDAAAAIVTVTTENMVKVIEEITIDQGIDPREAVLVGGGGAAGLNSVAIARRLGCRTLLIPESGAVLSAAGAIMSDLSDEYAVSFTTSSSTFDYEGVNRALAELESRCEEFVAGPGAGAVSTTIEHLATARYAGQVWDLVVPFDASRFGPPGSTEDGPVTTVDDLVESFHRIHESVFTFRDEGRDVDVTGFRTRVSCRLRAIEDSSVLHDDRGRGGTARDAFFTGRGWVKTPVISLTDLVEGEAVNGPLLIESPITTVVLDHDSAVEPTAGGGLVITVSPTSKPAQTK